jgi:hypothetical protein
MTRSSCELKLEGLRPYVEQLWGWDEGDQQRRFLDYFDPSMLQVICVGAEDVGFLHLMADPTNILLHKRLGFEVTTASDTHVQMCLVAQPVSEPDVPYGEDFHNPHASYSP